MSCYVTDLFEFYYGFYYERYVWKLIRKLYWHYILHVQ